MKDLGAMSQVLKIKTLVAERTSLTKTHFSQNQGEVGHPQFVHRREVGHPPPPIQHWSAFDSAICVA
jgi:hypothetical protein